MEIKYGIVGSRSRTDKEVVTAFVRSLPAGSIVISGGCHGVDTWAEKAAQSVGIETRIFLPDKAGCGHRWEFTKAFHARNQLIAEECDILVAFVSKDRKGGTEDTVKRADKLGREIWIK